MKKVLVGGVVVSLGVGLLAANPHFIRATSFLDSEGNVTISWKEAGLGDSLLVTYVASANATATYVCVNNGGQCPNAANKQSLQGPVSSEGTFPSGKNGQVTASLTIEPPAPTPFCPGGQHEVLADVSYAGITLTDVTNGVAATPTPSSVSGTFFVCP